MGKINFNRAVLLSAIIISANISCSHGDMINDGVESAEDLRQPEINIKQGTADIQPVSSSTAANISTEGTIFTIENLGTADLELTGHPVIALGGEESGEFSAQGPSSAVIPAACSGDRKYYYYPAAKYRR